MPPASSHSIEYFSGASQSNHDVDVTIIRPWAAGSGPDAGDEYPVIVWGNGWAQGVQNSEGLTEGYLPGLIEWAKAGPFIIVAANQWSVQESDLLESAQWMIDQGNTAGSQYENAIDASAIALAGHSQGAGAVVKAGGSSIVTATIAMNPYGPSWVNPGDQNGPMFILGGTDDLLTPVSSFASVWTGVQANGVGGMQAILTGGTHNEDAWAPADDYYNPDVYDFGEYQEITELYLKAMLNGDDRAGRTAKRKLDKAPWATDYAFTSSFQL